MKVSIVIPVYNEEKYIENCLKNIINQTEKPDEIIIIDNNCTDNTINIAKKFGVKIIQEKKQGMIHARNCGFNYASSDIIARCDADTLVPNDWVKKIKKNFEKNNLDSLTGPLIFYDLFSATYFGVKFYFWFMKLLTGGVEIIVGPNMIITKKIWEKVKNQVCLNDKEVHEDIDISIHIHQVGGIIKNDSNLSVQASGRRIKSNPLSFFFEYPIRAIKTLRKHK